MELEDILLSKGEAANIMRYDGKPEKIAEAAAKKAVWAVFEETWDRLKNRHRATSVETVMDGLRSELNAIL